MMKYVYILAAMLLIGAALEWHGHHRGYDSGVADTNQAASKRVDKADKDRQRAIAERDAAAETLGNVQRELREQKSRLELARMYADAALAARTALQQKLDAANAARIGALRKAAHDSPDCSDLARLPVCPAVAERLWGLTPNPTPGDGGGGAGAGVPAH